MFSVNLYGVFANLINSVGLSKPLAYLDPGTGSYIIQLLIAGLMGGLFLLKTYWGKIKALFTKESPVEEISSEDAHLEGGDNVE
jgi:hypothetical protein